MGVEAGRGDLLWGLMAMMLEYEKHKWLNPNCVALAEYTCEKKAIESRKLDPFLGREASEDIHTLTLTLLPGMIGECLVIKGPEDIRRACDALGIPYPTPLQTTSVAPAGPPSP